MKNNDAEILGRVEAQLEAVNKKLDILIKQSAQKPVERSFGSNRGFEDKSNKMQYKAICSECGESCGVPFKPSGGRPVFCSACFAKQQGGGEEAKFNKKPRDFRKPGDFRKPAAGKKPFFKIRKDK